MLGSTGQVCVPTFLGTNPTFITTTACNILAVNACNLGLAQVSLLVIVQSSSKVARKCSISLFSGVLFDIPSKEQQQCEKQQPQQL